VSSLEEGFKMQPSMAWYRVRVPPADLTQQFKGVYKGGLNSNIACVNVIFNPRTYKQSHNPPWYKGGLMGPLPWRPLVESLSCGLQDEVYIMVEGAAVGL